MSERKTKVPAIPAIGKSEREVSAALSALKEVAEIGAGVRGDKLDRYVTVRELQNIGIVRGDGNSVTSGFQFDGPQTGVDIPGSGNGLPNNDPPDYGQNDFTPPPMPTNIKVVPIAPASFMVTFDPPNYGNHAYAEVYIIPQAVGTTYQQFIAASGNFNLNRPCTGAVDGANPNQWFRARCEGSNCTIRVIATDLSAGAGSALDTDPLGSALNPTPVYVFVRFVSRANVVGPFGPQGTGASGRPSIDPVLVLDLMTQSVTSSPLYSHLRGFIGTDPAALASIAATGGVTSLYNDTVANGTSLERIWSVRMEQVLDTDNPDFGWVAAGFGLGVTVDSESGATSSIFAVNADRFAIMGNGLPYVKITGTQAGSDGHIKLVLALPSRFRMGQVVVVRAPNGDSLWDEVEATIIGDGTSTVYGENEVIIGNRVELVRNVKAGEPDVPFPGTSPVGLYMTGATNIPFIVDTLHGVVGIRGKLVVDGLVRATEGDFDTLTANQAFINSLRAGIINANIVCAQSIIAGDGIPEDSVTGGAISDSDLELIDSWIVKIAKPGPGKFPLRIYNPKRSLPTHEGAYDLLTVYGGDPLATGAAKLPYLYMNGDFRLGGNATMNLRSGGAVGFGAPSLSGASYTFWAGADMHWNTTRANMDDKGFMWIRPTIAGEEGYPGAIRGGLNLDLFLGENALALPVLAANNQAGAGTTDSSAGIRASSLVVTAISAGSLRVRGLRTGATASTLVTASGRLISFGTGTPNGDHKRFKLKATLVSTSGGADVPVQEIEMDDYSPEVWDYTIMTVVQAPAGTYRIKLDLTNIDDRPMSIVQGWNAMAMQVAANGGLS